MLAFSHHPLSNLLCQEERAFQVDGDQSVKALFTGLQHVFSDFWCNSCVVDQNIDAAKLLFHKINQFESITSVADVCLAHLSLNAMTACFARYRLGSLLMRTVIHHQIKMTLCQGKGNSLSDAPASSGHQSNSVWMH